jgi:PIN domain nuclease of toxin-antitoxin system
MLMRKRRAQLRVPPAEWRSEVLSRGIEEIPIDGMIAVQAGTLDGPNGDPADRIIVTTAMRRNLTLITADRRILAWPGPLKTMDARL